MDPLLQDSLPAPLPGLTRRPVAAAAKYAGVYRITLANALAYVPEFLARALFMAVVMFVFVQLWRTTYRGTGEGEIGGLTLAQMVWYLVLTESVIMARPPLAPKIDAEVRSGDLAYALSKPYDYLLFHAASYLAEASVRLAVIFAAGAAVALPSVGGIAVPAVAWPATMVALGLSFLVTCFSHLAIGLLAFWTEDTFPFLLLYDRVAWILGGLLLPLDIFPPALARLTRVLPFGFEIYGPARLGVAYDPAAALRLYLGQVAWLAVFAVLAYAIYRKGVRRVNANGG